MQGTDFVYNTFVPQAKLISILIFVCSFFLECYPRRITQCTNYSNLGRKLNRFGEGRGGGVLGKQIHPQFLVCFSPLCRLCVIFWGVCRGSGWEVRCIEVANQKERRDASATAAWRVTANLFCPTTIHVSASVSIFLLVQESFHKLKSLLSTEEHIWGCCRDHPSFRSWVLKDNQNQSHTTKKQ